MPRKDEELKRKLMAQIEEIIDQMLAGRSPDDEITLSEIEQLVVEARGDIGEQILAALVDVEQVEQPECAQCGGKMQDKGQRTRQLVTVGGEVRLQSHYYYCPVCKTGFSPSA